MRLAAAIAILVSLCGAIGGAQDPGAIRDLLNEKEKRSLDRAKDLSGRTKALLDAAGRYLKSAESSFSSDQFAGMTSSLRSYLVLLEECDTELDSMGKGKRPNLKKHEITIRRYLSTLENLQARASYDERATFAEAIRISDSVRRHFLSTFFGGDALKKP